MTVRQVYDFLLLRGKRRGQPSQALRQNDCLQAVDGFLEIVVDQNVVVLVVVLNLATGAAAVDPYLAYAPTNANTLEVPVVASHVGITTANPRLSYVIQSFDNVGALGSDAILTPASFNAFNNAISTAAFASLPPGGSAAVPITIDRGEFARTPALGVMVVSTENTTHEQSQALLLRIGGD